MPCVSRVADCCCPRQLIGAYAARHTQSGTNVRVGIGMAAAQGPDPEPMHACPMVHGALDTGGPPYLGRRQEPVLPDVLLAAEPTQPPIRIGWFEDLESMVFLNG